uniref:Uncharacterized protein n=1 Tax=Rhizophagus irregularis (strain DAOM 181602 / DAOM 197198 / MUCL 43194) TaxID=747089 RepID=U9SHB4_RHIID
MTSRFALANAAMMDDFHLLNSMTNDILQNKSSIEIKIESNSMYPSFLTPKNDYYDRSSFKKSVFIFSDEQTSDKIVLNSIFLVNKSSSSIRISVGTNTNINGNDSSSNLGIKRISRYIKHQK